MTVASPPAIIEGSAERKAPLIAGARPRPIVPTNLEDAWRIAQYVAKSGLAPKDMERAETIIIAIMHGLEIGLPPMMALQRIAVINKRPALWGDGAIALVRASGLCEWITETTNGVGDNMIATCTAKRRGEREATKRTFSVDDAKRAGLWAKSGPWQQYPTRMLQMRARAFALRDLFADVLGGLYLAEELPGVQLEGGDEDRPLKDATPQVQPLPPSIPTRREPPPQTAPPDKPAAEPSNGTRPLPPLARRRPEAPPDFVLMRNKRAAEAPVDDGIPVSLMRNAPPADEPATFRAWITTKLSAAQSLDDLQTLWDSHIAPNIDEQQFQPADLDDLRSMFSARRVELE